MSSLRFVSQWPIQCSVWRSVNLNDYTEQYMVISLRLAAIILALSISLVRLKCIETHARRKIWQKKLMAVCIQWNDLSGHIFLYRFRGDMARPQSLLLKKKRRNTSAETRRVNAFLNVSYSSQLKQKKRRKKWVGESNRKVWSWRSNSFRRVQFCVHTSPCGCLFKGEWNVCTSLNVTLAWLISSFWADRCDALE